MWKYLTRLETFVVTSVIFLLFWLISLLPLQNVDWLNPLSDALSDFELTDVVFSKIQDPATVPVDTNIVVVNIGRLPRNQVAQVLHNLYRARPAVIGIDALYREAKSPAVDTPLTNALRNAPVPVVMVTELAARDPETGAFHEVRRSHPMFSDYAHEGYANITNAEAHRTIREISPYQIVNDDTAYSFSIALMRFANPAAAQACLARNNPQERINWRGHRDKFFLVDTDAALDSAADLGFLRGKTVLLAFVDLSDERVRALEDLYFTPLNKQYAGKALPDMYGIYIHANMLSMMQHGTYIDTMPEWQGVLWAVALGYLNVALFLWVYHERQRWFDLAVVVSQIALNLLVLYLVIIVFDKLRYEIQVNTIVLVLLLGPSILEIVVPLWQRLETRLRRNANTASTHPQTIS